MRGTPSASAPTVHKSVCSLNSHRRASPETVEVWPPRVQPPHGLEPFQFGRVVSGGVAAYGAAAAYRAGAGQRSNTWLRYRIVSRIRGR